MAAPDSAVTKTLFQTVRTGTQPELRFLALARAMKAGDPTALGEVASNAAVLPQLLARHFVSLAIAGQGFSASPELVAPLSVIAGCADPSLQVSAADALMSIHTQATLPALASLLSSADPQTRELAMKGLSRFVDNLPSATRQNVINLKSIMPQGPAPYKTADTDRYSLSTRSLVNAPESEAAYLQFWKSWWATMKNQLAPGQ